MLLLWRVHARTDLSLRGFHHVPRFLRTVAHAPVPRLNAPQHALWHDTRMEEIGLVASILEPLDRDAVEPQLNPLPPHDGPNLPVRLGNRRARREEPGERLFNEPLNCVAPLLPRDELDLYLHRAWERAYLLWP